MSFSEQPEQAATPDTDLSRALSELRRMSRPWSVRPRLPQRELTGVTGVSRLGVQLLSNRGYPDAEAIHSFLAADWRATEPISSQLDIAVTIILGALRAGERINVYGDFDCDGLSSCALLVIALRSLSSAPETITPYVPERAEEGRGLNLDAVRAIAASGARLIVTCDCGSANVAEVALAKTLGARVIITDHHPQHGPLPDAAAIINPQIETQPNAHRQLAGAGVAFRLAEALLQRATTEDDPLPNVKDLPENFIASLLDLVAIGTVGDVAPMFQENWALVHSGLRRLNQAPRLGIRSLARSAGLALGGISARDISFALAPRLNAAGRMDTPLVALRLLLTRDPIEASHLAAELETLNRARQRHTEEIMTAARAQAHDQLTSGSTVIVAWGEAWKQGVLGLVAGRLAEESGLPAFVLSLEFGHWRGSARGQEGVDLGALLEARPDFFAHFGGHARAAGFTLANAELDAFVAYIRAQFAPVQTLGGATERAATADDDEGADNTGAALDVDGELPFNHLRDEHYDTIAALEPYGPGFAEPLFLAPRVRVTSSRRSGLAGANLRLRLQDGSTTRDAVWSKRGELHEVLRPVLWKLPPMDVVYQLTRYLRSDTQRIEWLARIVAMRPSDDPDASPV
ncbi:MAG TPA: single-stranded-DNA-specific exonuclease RecJ [Ktedonobacterales bacterium]|nr:single-stranded-DNA-specific exonuclease RecJ [Ktedonobacterales bacterium]